MSSLLERYHRSEREQVWHELRQLGDRVQQPKFRDEAQAVCDEMARRARHNIEIIVDRLTEQGYRFHSNDDDQQPVRPFIPATPDAPGLADWLANRFGPLPMALGSWTRIVGDVWLVGTHPDWPESSAADPLVIEIEYSRYQGSSARDFFEAEHDAWQDWSADDPDAGGFLLPLAPDRLHKANISGGGPYGVRLPDGCAEGVFVGEVAMPFVAYLNWVFAHGGFPARTDGANQAQVRRALASGLLPL